MTRSLRPDVRNPIVGLPAFDELRNLDGAAKAALLVTLLDIRVDARGRANEAWRRNKGPMAAYWKSVAVYAGHIARVLR